MFPLFSLASDSCSTPIGLSIWVAFELPKLEPDTSHIIVLSHGLGDTAASWPSSLATILDDETNDTSVIALDWNPYSQNALRCSVDGQRIGQRIGEHLIENPNLESVHLIGHSCGAFINLGACLAIKKVRPTVTVQTTYLDAVSVYGGIFWKYGLRNFGSCADFSDAYIDTGDSVPGSNQNIPAAYTFDVTAARESSGYSGSAHVWPTRYYQQLAEDKRIPDLSTTSDLSQRYPTGGAEKVD